jgi:hypothetical protein
MMVAGTMMAGLLTDKSISQWFIGAVVTGLCFNGPYLRSALENLPARREVQVAAGGAEITNPSPGRPPS